MLKARLADLQKDLRDGKKRPAPVPGLRTATLGMFWSPCGPLVAKADPLQGLPTAWQALRFRLMARVWHVTGCLCLGARGGCAGGLEGAERQSGAEHKGAVLSDVKLCDRTP